MVHETAFPRVEVSEKSVFTLYIDTAHSMHSFACSLQKLDLTNKQANSKLVAVLA